LLDNSENARVLAVHKFVLIDVLWLLKHFGDVVLGYLESVVGIHWLTLLEVVEKDVISDGYKPLQVVQSSFSVPPV